MIVVYIIQILLQLYCAGLCAWHLQRFRTPFWALMLGAFVLMTFRRVTALVVALGGSYAQGADGLWLPLTISIFVAAGLHFAARGEERASDVRREAKRLRELLDAREVDDGRPD